MGRIAEGGAKGYRGDGENSGGRNKGLYIGMGRIAEGGAKGYMGMGRIAEGGAKG